MVGGNLLGVGLHSYGFRSGILLTLLGFYAVEALVLAAGGAHFALTRGAAPAHSGALPIAPVRSAVLDPAPGGVR